MNAKAGADSILVAQEDSESDLVRPAASSLAESMRAFGYDVWTAVADLVDNSITARAKNIWVDFFWDGNNSTIAVTDDGAGMTESQLLAAMRLGSTNPREVREEHDLGRFGLGMKTASFSQCRRMTVRSKTASSPEVTRCWDLDHIAKVNEWRLLREADKAAEEHLQRIGRLGNGTAVLWQRLDRLAADFDTANDRHHQHFLNSADTVRRYLSVVFHRLIAERNGLNIFINDVPVVPWDPFLAEEAATQIFPVTRLSLRGASLKVTPYILPHHSKIDKTKHDSAAGTRGWNAHQGFYVYRNRRLLVAGDWLGMGWAKEEHYKLARIKIDLPNSVDHEWEIDVTKSRAAPPKVLRDDLRRIGERARSEAKRIYSHRGAKLAPRSDVDRVLLWEPLAKNDKTFYRINRDHPLVVSAISASENPLATNALLRLIEETIPFAHITISNSEKPNSLPAPFETSPTTQIVEVMLQAYNSLVESGYEPEAAINRLRSVAPFDLFPAVLESLAEKKLQ